MPNDELLTDDYVAGLLAKEASDQSIKYSAMGLEAFESNKKPTNMPKPNTRFLRHIIKDTDTHNKALLAKEAAESRARLKDLERAEEAKRRKSNPHSRDIRKRQMGDIQAILGSKPRRRRSADGEDATKSRDSGKRQTRNRDDDKSSKPDKDLFREQRQKSRRDHGRLNRGEHSQSNDDDDRSRRREKKSRRTRDQSSSPEQYDKYGKTRSRRERSRSPDRERRLRSPGEKRSKHRQRSSHRSPPRNKNSSSKTSSKLPPATNDKDDDSDPLDDLIGPAPPPRYRGRGKVTGSAGLDRRFSESYDPAADVDMDEDAGDTWDDAVEAFRDRQRLRQNRDERMRAAGFADEQIQKANKGTAEKAEDDVRWAKAGEEREWDRDKS